MVKKSRRLFLERKPVVKDPSIVAYYMAPRTKPDIAEKHKPDIVAYYLAPKARHKKQIKR